MKFTLKDIGNLNNGLQDKLVESEVAYRDEKLKVGLVGSIFGAGENVGRNVAGVIALLSLVTAILGTLIPVWKGKPVDYEGWKYLSPIVMGALGFLFGQSRNGSKAPNS